MAKEACCRRLGGSADPPAVRAACTSCPDEHADTQQMSTYMHKHCNVQPVSNVMCVLYAANLHALLTGLLAVDSIMHRTPLPGLLVPQQEQGRQAGGRAGQQGEAWRKLGWSAQVAAPGQAERLCSQQALHAWPPAPAHTQLSADGISALYLSRAGQHGAHAEAG